MRPFEWYNLTVYHVMGSSWKSSFSKKKTHKNTFFVLYLLISPTKSTFSLGKKILVALNTYAKKNELTLDRLGGGGAW